MTSEWPFNPSQIYDQMVQDVKASSGYSHVPTPMPYVNLSQVETSHPNYRSPRARKRKESPVTSTGSSVWRSPRRSLLPELLACLEPESMPNSPVPMPQPPTNLAELNIFEAVRLLKGLQQLSDIFFIGKFSNFPQHEHIVFGNAVGNED